jgi:hypothetical protein
VLLKTENVTEVQRRWRNEFGASGGHLNICEFKCKMYITLSLFICELRASKVYIHFGTLCIKEINVYSRSVIHNLFHLSAQ